jgi:hypothetical protein
MCYSSPSRPSVESGCEWRPERVLSIRRRTSEHADVAWTVPNSKGRDDHRQPPEEQTVLVEEVAREADGQAAHPCRLSSCPPSWAVVSLSRAGLWTRDRRFRVGSSLVYSHGSSERQASCSICPCSTLWKTISTVWQSGSGRAKLSGCGEEIVVRQLLHLDQAISACYTAKAGLDRATIVVTILEGDREGLRSAQAEILAVLPKTLLE